MKWPYGTQPEPETQPVEPAVAVADLAPTVHTPAGTPAPTVIKRVGGVMPEVTQPTGALRKPIEKHEHARLDEHEPGESVDHRGTVRRDN